jgi:hypothetical protein
LYNANARLVFLLKEMYPDNPTKKETRNPYSILVLNSINWSSLKPIFCRMLSVRTILIRMHFWRQSPKSNSMQRKTQATRGKQHIWLIRFERREFNPRSIEQMMERIVAYQGIMYAFDKDDGLTSTVTVSVVAS